jgi:hypothetical protein
MNLFCLDTSALIEPWHRRYPMDVFPSFWDRLDQWIDGGRAIAPDEVLREIAKVDDDLHTWAKQRAALFRPPEADVQKAVKAILRDYPRLVDSKRGRSIADPWVIAQAQVASAAVVTEEQRSTGSSPRIPDVCDSLGLQYTNVLGLIREMGLKL